MHTDRYLRLLSFKSHHSPKLRARDVTPKEWTEAPAESDAEQWLPSLDPEAERS